jgi:CRISPR-associated endonuclease/helicase Cas3
MAYPVKAPPAQRDDTLLRMLGENGMAVHDARIGGVTRSGLMQSFASAAKEFRALDSQTQGIIVPFRAEGTALIADLCAARELGLEFKLMRKAQQFAVNVFPHELKALGSKGAIYEAQAGTGVLCLHEGFYSAEFGLSLDGRERMESTIA